MNGYAFTSFNNFQNDWKLVTVRYRQDTGELRFVYANDVAWKGLASAKGEYADGAVFGKIGFASKEDTNFKSSLTPDGVRRFQFMVRDKTKHKQTGGWGYALFDKNGKTFPEELQKQTMACFACHSLVSNLGYVFSKKVPLFDAPEKRNVPENALLFEEIETSLLPESVKNLLPAGVVRVKSVIGPLRNHLFQGTLDEIRPALAREAARSGFPALLISEDRSRFSLVLSEKERTCGNAQGKSVSSYKGIHNYVNDPKKLFTVSFCL